jgi:hypothetical protein
LDTAYCALDAQPFLSSLILRAQRPLPFPVVEAMLYDVFEANGSPIVELAVERISALYRIEAVNCATSADERKVVHKTQSHTLVDAMKLWLEQEQARSGTE